MDNYQKAILTFYLTLFPLMAVTTVSGNGKTAESYLNQNKNNYALDSTDVKERKPLGLIETAVIDRLSIREKNLYVLDKLLAVQDSILDGISNSGGEIDSATSKDLANLENIIGNFRIGVFDESTYLATIKQPHVRIMAESLFDEGYTYWGQDPPPKNKIGKENPSMDVYIEDYVQGPGMSWKGAKPFWDSTLNKYWVKIERLEQIGSGW